MQATRRFSLLGVMLLACGLASAPLHAELPYDPPITIKKSRASTERPFGREGDPRKVKRVIRIEMSDTMRYFPAELKIRRGDTVRFMLKNTGKMPHGMVIGSMDELKRRAALVKKDGDAAVSGAPAARVAPGGSARLVWQFTRPGEYYYGCLVPGHFDAGMIGTIIVR
jgi:uncharacterized cupredoxin-like copper-binding protein